MAQPSVSEWLDNFHASEAKVWVEDPETNTEKVGGFLGITKQYVTFRILLKCLGRDIIGIRHRFSEFESMRNSMKATFSSYGIAVPGMPPKKIVVSVEDEGFIKERTQGLTLFCQAIVASPWLRFDKSWIDFMRSGAADSVKSGNVGESMLLLSFAQLEPPGNAYARMNEFKDELLIVERSVQGMIAAAKSLQSAQAAVVKANAAMEAALMDWMDTEKNNTRLLSGDTYGNAQPLLKSPYKVGASVGAYHTFMNDHHVANAESAIYTGVLLVAALEHEISRIESFRELFDTHDKLSREIDTLALKEQKLRGSKDGKKDQIAEIARQVVEKRNLLTMFYKGLFHYSIPMNIRQRSINLRSCMTMMAALHNSSARENKVISEKFFRELKASPPDCAAEASAVLDLLALKTFDCALTDENAEVLPPQPPSTRDMFDEALAKNAKGFNPAVHNTAAVNKATGYDTVAPAAVSPVAPAQQNVRVGGRDGYPERPVSQSPPPVATPAAVAPTSVPPPAPAPVAQGSRGSMPGLLGRRSSQNTAPAAPAAPAAADPVPTASPAPEQYSTTSTMQEVSEETIAAERAPSPVPEPVPAKPKPPSAKTQSLLDDLMGGGNTSAPKKSAADSLWD